jgi:ketosteroid isomerase-like protein
MEDKAEAPGSAAAGLPEHRAIRRLYDCYCRQDLDALAPLLDPAILFRQAVALGTVPMARPLAGRDAVLERLVRMSAVWTVTQLDILSALVDPPSAAVRVLIEYRDRRSGDLLPVEYAHFWRFAGGRAIELVEFYDSATVAQAIRAGVAR